MLSYKIINNRPDLTAQIWQKESEAPNWYRESSKIWHPTFESFEAFWRACEVFGLFDDDKLLACVYIENIAPATIRVHVSVIEKVNEPDLVRFFQSLIRQKVGEGIEVIVGWVVDRNRGLLRVAEKASFERTGLVMRYGSIRGKVVNWIQVRAR